MFIDLFGMTYKAIELEHPVEWSISKVLKSFSRYLKESNIDGTISSISTGAHPDDEALFLTVLVYSVC